MGTISQKVENINTEIEIKCKKRIIKNSGAENTINEVENSLHGTNSRFEQTEDRFSELADRPVGLPSPGN